MSAMDISEEEQQDTPNTATTEQMSVGATVVSSAQASSGLSISVHPLVLLNISDHYTRTSLLNTNDGQPIRVYGALLAQQSGRDIDIVNSFELPIPQQDKIDKQYLATKQEQLKQVFPDLDFMGWYTLGSFPTETNLKLHEQFLELNESSLFLQLDPVAPSKGSKEFPITIYESTMDMVQDQVRLVFVKVPYKVETSEAERIAVDHVAKPSVSGGGADLGNTLISHLTTQRNAIAMLHARISFLHQYLQDVKDGVLPMDHDVIRQISTVCRRSPLMDSSAFNEQFSTELNDVLLAAYLTTITKGLNAVNDLVVKFNLTQAGSAGTGAGTMHAGKTGLVSPMGGQRRRAMGKKKH